MGVGEDEVLPNDLIGLRAGVHLDRYYIITVLPCYFTSLLLYSSGSGQGYTWIGTTLLPYYLATLLLCYFAHQAPGRGTPGSVLPSYRTTLLLYFFTTLLIRLRAGVHLDRYYLRTVLPCYFTSLLLYSSGSGQGYTWIGTTLLPYYLTTLLPYYLTSLLLYFFTTLLPGSGRPSCVGSLLPLLPYYYMIFSYFTTLLLYFLDRGAIMRRELATLTTQ